MDIFVKLEKNKKFMEKYNKFKKKKQEKEIKRRVKGTYKFVDRKKDKKNLCIIIAGYKKILWEDVFGRLEKFMPKDMDVCIVSSGLYNEELDKIEINKDFTKKVFKNLDAKEYTKEDDIKNILAKHVMSPVRFSKSVENMINQGVDTFIEIGPGKVLSGFIRKINKEVKVLNIQDKESLENTLKILKEEN